MTERQPITIAGQSTFAHVTPLTDVDLVLYAPATHRGVCIAVSGIKTGDEFDYDGTRFQVLRAWDEAAERLRGAPRAGGSTADFFRSGQAAQASSFYQNRTGKFIDMMLIEVAE